MATKSHLGKHYIRQWREYRGLSLRKLADKMEITPGIPLTSHANIGRIETFQQPYSQDILEAIAIALNVSVIDLLSVNPIEESTSIDRKIANLPQQQKDQVKSYVEFLLKSIDEI